MRAKKTTAATATPAARPDDSEVSLGVFVVVCSSSLVVSAPPVVVGGRPSSVVGTVLALSVGKGVAVMLDVMTCTVLMLVGIEVMIKGVIPVGDGVTESIVKTIVDDGELLGSSIEVSSPLPTKLFTSLDINERGEPGEMSTEMVLVRGVVIEGVGVN